MIWLFRTRGRLHGNFYIRYLRKLILGDIFDVIEWILSQIRSLLFHWALLRFLVDPSSLWFVWWRYHLGLIISRGRLYLFWTDHMATFEWKWMWVCLNLALLPLDHDSSLRFDFTCIDELLLLVEILTSELCYRWLDTYTIKC